jgi:diadenylate cyclase
MFYLSVIPWLDIIDAFIVFLITYRCLLWLKKSQAFNLVKGFFIIFLVYIISKLLHLTALIWLLEKFSTILIFLVVIIFQPEIRKLLEKIGRGSIFNAHLLSSEGQNTIIINNLLKAIDHFSQNKIGALIAIEKNTYLTEYIESGIPINGTITPELLINLFFPHSPTHDGAIIIREDKIISTGSLLPLTDTKIRDHRLGTRHRAALGLSELSDALIIAVSEETGVISIAENATLTRYLTKEGLETRLFNHYAETIPQEKLNLKYFKDNFLKKEKNRKD